VLPGVLTVLAAVPPWLIMAGLLGIINAAACFMLVGRRLRRLVWYVSLGVLAAWLGQALGTGLRLPDPVRIGDVHVAAASGGAWAAAMLLRLAGLTFDHR